MEEDGQYSEGKWIVHSFYGVGQMKGVEVKGISGEEVRYYRIETADSTFWIPVEQMDSEIARPVATREEIHQAVAALKRAPRSMSPNYKARQHRIQRVQDRNAPKAVARLIRDLRALQREKGVLSKNERSAFRSLKQRLAEEWALVTGIQIERAASKLDYLLERHEAAAEGQSDASPPGQATAISKPSRQRQRSEWPAEPGRQNNNVNRSWPVMKAQVHPSSVVRDEAKESAAARERRSEP